MDVIEIFSLASIAVFLYVSVLWIISLLRHDMSIIDIGWGLGFIVVSFVTMFVNVSFVPRSFLVMSIVVLWGLRLTIHLFLRQVGRGEDWRYKVMRERFGPSYVLMSYVNIFLFQGFLMLLISIPIVYVHYSASGGNLSGIDLLGAVVWFAGFVIETVSDYQLMSFKAKSQNKEKIMKQGFWKYSRHPNYFGEAVQWWGLFLIGLALPGALWTIIGPLTITYLLVFVSGVPLLEKKYRDNKEYDQYRRTTSPFFLWLPRKTMGQRVG